MANLSILLIEHEDSLREVLGACLTELGGWDVTFSSSIREGIRLCEQKKPNAILLDTSIPETDVWFFIEQLKTYAHERSVPVLIISSRASWFTTEQLREMGFAGAIAKPFNPSTLPAYIENLIKSSEN
jgi:DNA-binding response OmpR family regulator